MNDISTQLRDLINLGLTRWRMAVQINKWTPPRKSGGIPQKVSTRFSLSMEMRRLTRDGTAEPVSRDQIVRRERGQGNIHFPCSADHEQNWQPHPVDPYYILALCDDHTYHIPYAWRCEATTKSSHSKSQVRPFPTIPSMIFKLFQFAERRLSRVQTVS